MSKTFDNTVLINIKRDQQISIEDHTDPSQYNREYDTFKIEKQTCCYWKGW